MLLNIGTSHKKLSLNILDCLTLRNPGQFYERLKRDGEFDGMLILQTCNRVEFFFDAVEESIEDLSERALQEWAFETNFKLGELKRIVERRTDNDVVRHLVRLGSGLESMLVGEPQILSQLKSSLADAQSHHAVSPLLTELFEKSARASSRVRRETGIEKGTVSLGSAAMRLAEAYLGPVRSRRIGIVGTGDVGVLMMKALRARKADSVTVVGRTREGAELFCRVHNWGRPLAFAELDSIVDKLDLLIVATGKTEPIIGKDILKAERKSKVVILDLATPRNVDERVGELPGIVLRTLEDLKGIAEESMAKRMKVVEEADRLADIQAGEVCSIIQRKNAEPLVDRLYHRADLVRVQELEKARSKLKLSPGEMEVLDAMSKNMVTKILGPTALHLRRAAGKGDRQILTVAGQIFGDEE